MPPVDHTKVRLGKLEYVFDPHTLKMARFISDEITAPPTFNVDKGKKPFPTNMWGNNAWGDCVLATRANEQLRFERIEQRRTIPMTDQIVIDKYKEMTGSQSPGDARDQGLVMLYANRDWRKAGWKVGTRNYNIYAYGELDPHNHEQLRQACFALAGLQFGFALPVGIQGKQGWIYNGETGGEWEPGSWGGHAVYCLGYDQNGMTIMTWGYKCKVNWAFIDKYADEAWAIVDNADAWRIKQTVDVAKLSAALSQITSHVDE